MLNKNYLFLCNVIVMAISNAAIATDIEEARNTLTQIYWRVQAHNTIEDAKWQVRENKTKDKPWFIDEDYDESIKQVIGKAIADCVTNMNEFKDKKAGDLITFDGPEYEDRPEDYTQENWNAVVLYNYVDDLIKLKNNSDSAKNMITNCVNRILNYYKSRLSDQRIQFTKECLIKANKDINKYVEAFKLVDVNRQKTRKTPVAYFQQKYAVYNSRTDRRTDYLDRTDYVNPKDFSFTKYKPEQGMYYRTAPYFTFDPKNRLCIKMIRADMIYYKSNKDTNEEDWFTPTAFTSQGNEALNWISRIEPSLIKGLNIAAMNMDPLKQAKQYKIQRQQQQYLKELQQCLKELE